MADRLAPTTPETPSSDTAPAPRLASRAWRISAIYAIAATTWIVVSDQVLGAIVTDAERVVTWSLVKGVAFVLVTTALLYAVVRRDFRRADVTHDVLVHDSQDQQRAAAALQETLDLQRRVNDELVEVTALRDRFLTAVSHELRTPLTVVQGLAEVLQRQGETLDLEARSQLLGRLDVNARQLSGLLGDLLDLNRLTAGRMVVDPECADLAAIVADAVAEVDVGTHPCTVRTLTTEVEVDAARIRRVIVNLLRNAVVHTPASTPIEVHMCRTDGVVQVRCADRGPGVPDAQKVRIFAPFEQGATIRGHQPGTGIGLSLAQEFVRMHAGHLWVEDSPGGGATFVMELPVAS